MPESCPVIFVPGITATYLEDRDPLPPETIWSALTKDYERAAPHPDDLRYEAREPAKAVPGQIYETAYKEFVEEVIDRAKVMRNYFPGYAAAPKVNLAGHFTGRGDPHDNTWGRPPPGVSDADWKPPVAGLRPKRRLQKPGALTDAPRASTRSA